MNHMKNAAVLIIDFIRTLQPICSPRFSNGKYLIKISSKYRAKNS